MLRVFCLLLYFFASHSSVYFFFTYISLPFPVSVLFSSIFQVFIFLMFISFFLREGVICSLTIHSHYFLFLLLLLRLSVLSSFHTNFLLFLFLSPRRSIFTLVFFASHYLPPPFSSSFFLSSPFYHDSSKCQLSTCSFISFSSSSSFSTSSLSSSS